MSSNNNYFQKVINYVGWVDHGNVGDEALYLVNSRIFNQYSLVPAKREMYSNITLFGGGTVFPDYAQKFFPNKYNYAVGIGVRNPSFWGAFNDYTIEMMKRHRFRFLGVRGNISQQILKTLNIESQVVGDPCLLLEPLSYPKKHKKLIALNFGISPDGIWGDRNFLLDQIVTFCKTLKHEGYTVVLVPFWKSDLPVIKHVSELVDLDIFQDWCDIQKLLDFISSCYVLIGQKLHSVVFSAATFTPFICMEYRPKCLDFTESVGFKKYTLRTDQITYSKLLASFYDLLDHWNDNQSLLVNKVSRYRTTLKNFVTEILKDIDNLPEDKWRAPGNLRNLENRLFWGSDFLLNKNFKCLWKALHISSLQKSIDDCRALVFRRN